MSERRVDLDHPAPQRRSRRSVVGVIAGVVAGGVVAAVTGNAALHRSQPKVAAEPSPEASSSAEPWTQADDQAERAQQEQQDGETVQALKPVAEAQAKELAALLNGSRGKGTYRARVYAGTVISPTADGRWLHTIYPLVFSRPGDNELAHQWFATQTTKDGAVGFGLTPYDGKREDRVVYLQDPQATSPYMNVSVYLDGGTGMHVPADQLPRMWALDGQGQPFTVMPASSRVTD